MDRSGGNTRPRGLREWCGRRFLRLLGRSGKLSGLTVRAVNIGVDRLVADTHGLTLKLKSTGDLFRRPTFFELLDHCLAQADKPHQFPSPRTSLGRCALGDHAVVSIQLTQVQLCMCHLSFSLQLSVLVKNLHFVCESTRLHQKVL